MIMLSENSSYGSAYLAEATSVDQLPGLFGLFFGRGWESGPVVGCLPL